MQAMYDSTEDYPFLNQGLNTSMTDFFDNLFNCPSDENSGSISDSPVSSPIDNTPEFNNINIPPIIKQELPEFIHPLSMEEPKNENNKRKRTAKAEKSEKALKNSKKIRKKHPEMQTAVTLSRDKLLTTTTEEFNKWVEEIKQSRPLTQEEVQDIRRQKRLIRNRESAQASRDRKKNEFTLLEQQIKQLKEEKENAMKELSEMRNKVDLLEKENLYMKTTIQHSPVLNEIYTGVGNFQSKGSNFDMGSITKGAKTAGVCLFILIFSLGLFFNTQNMGYQHNSTQQKIYLPQQNLPRVTPVDNVPSLRPIGTNARKLLFKTRNQLSTYENPQILGSISNIPGDTNDAIPEVAPLTLKNVEASTNNETTNAMPFFEQQVAPNLHLYCMNAKEYVLNPNVSNELTFNLMLPRNSISPNSPFFRYIDTQDDLIELTCKLVHNR